MSDKLFSYCAISMAYVLMLVYILVERSGTPIVIVLQNIKKERAAVISTAAYSPETNSVKLLTQGLYNFNV